MELSSKTANRNRANLHGGAFLWGGEFGGLVESIPIAAVGGFKVVAVDYRLSPEHVFPVALEDVAAVYAGLLGDFGAKSIGIYGCSAGGVLAAQAVAWLARASLPVPGAVGTFCGTGLEFGGDSTHLAPLTGDSGKSQTTPVRLRSLPYFQGTSDRDPGVFPFVSDDGVRCFPPTLMIAGGRDFAANSLTVAHRRLSAVGCESRLYLFDSMRHAFFADAELPKSQEAYDLICGFFGEWLQPAS